MRKVQPSRFRIGVGALVVAIVALGVHHGAGALPAGDAVLTGAVDSGGRSTSSVFVRLCQGADCTNSAINAGGYSFPGVAPGSYTLSVQASASPDFVSAPLGPVTLVSGANVSDLVLPLGGRVFGTVTNPDGSTRAGAPVAACVPSGPCGTAISGLDGTFVTTAVPVGPVEVRASSGVFEAVPTVYPSLPVSVTAAAGVASPSGPLRLRAAGSLTGTVRDANGNAVVGAVVQLTGSTALAVTSAQTVSGGAYTFASLEPGLRSVAVGAGLGAQLSSGGQVTIAEGVASVLDLALPAAARITGVYSRADGLPLVRGFDDGVILCPGATDASVFTPPMGFCPGFSIVSSAADGSFDLAGRPAGTYSLAALGGGYALGYPLRSQSVTVAVGAGETAACTFVLDAQPTPGPATCSVIVPDGDGIPDAVEDAGPNGGDGNLDGVADSQQAEVATLPAAVGGGYVTVAAPDGLALSAVSVVDPSTLATPPPAWTSLPFGLVDFTIAGVTPGGSVGVELRWSGTGPTPNAWFKVLGGALVDATSLVADPAADPILLTLTDNAFGDDDPTPGVIHDPSGPAVTDRTAPSLTCGAAPTFRVGQSPALVSATVADTGSGPVRTTVSAPADTTTPGTRSVVLEGSDQAGNTGAATCSYTVERPAPLSRLITFLRWLLGLLRG